MEVVQVQPRDSYLHYLYCSKNTVLRWSFTTKRNNISFGLFRRRGKDPLPSTSAMVMRAKPQKKQMSSMSLLDQDTESVNGANSIASQYTSRPRSKSTAAHKLIEGGMDEIIPIQHTHSSNHKIEGQYQVDEPGNYVLVFDNTYSINTPKTLTYSVALSDTTHAVKAEVCGWILKKKRKRMQGWAKRWFTLSPSGVLSYSTSEDGITRGSIQILVSSIAYSPKQRQIHVDSGTMLYHLKTLTEEDYEKWTNALRDFKANIEPEQDSHPPTPSATSSTSKRHSNFRQKQRSSGLPDLKLQVSRGIELSAQMQDIATTVMARVTLLQQLLTPDIANDDIKSVFAQLEKEKHVLLSNADEQLAQWHSIHACMNSSPNMSPCQKLTVPSESIHRTLSVSSRRSGYSDKFFDAEDIELSDGEEEEDGIIIDNNDSSDDESGDNAENDNNSNSIHGELNLDSIKCNSQRRSKLPSPAVSDPGSALAVFRKNVGKDLSTIAMPISMNEPLNMLQRACEELEYCDLLAKASTCTDALERLMYVTAFSISTYCSTQFRTGRKPFNPMMTETYENIRPDLGFRFVSEKVSHNPLIIAAHAEAKEFKYWQSTEIKSKFWGKSMEFMTQGTFHVTLAGHDDHFTFFKPSSWMKNMIAGEKYLEHAGECKVTNKTTGDYAVVTFKEGTGGGLFGAPTKRDDVVAVLYDKDGKKKRRVVGKWSKSLAEEVNMDKRQLSVLWSAHAPGIDQPEKYFGFTKFATELNEVTDIEKQKIPITDTRLRPDQRLYEEGKVDEADEEKLRIEQKQRERRKDFEVEGKPWSPRWFTCEGDEWQYAGQYWQSRETGQWPQDQFSLW